MLVDWWCCSFGILLASDPSFHNLCMLSHEQGSCFYQEGVDRCSWGMVHRKSVVCDHVSGGHGVQHVPHVLHTNCSCSRLHSVVCSADFYQVRYPLVMADLHKLFAQLDVSIWDCPNQPALNFKFYCCIAAIADLCPLGQLAYPID